MILHGADVNGVSSGINTGDIANSVRFRGAQYASRTFGTATSRKIFFLLIPVKRGKLGVRQDLMQVGAGSSPYWQLYFDANDKLVYDDYNGSQTALLTSTRVFRDPLSHGFLTIMVDTTQSTAADKMKWWWNNEAIARTGTEYSGTPDSAFNQAASHTIGGRSGTYFDGYFSRFCEVDGTAGLTYASVIEFNSTINEWVSKSQSAVKAVVDAGGTNSFMLDFDDATSTTTLGYDKSSKGNNWTCNNISLTAGVTYDHMTDVPGNSYATLNPLDSKATLSNGNLTSTAGGSNQDTRTTFAMTTGKWYWEAKAETIATGNATPRVGVANSAESLTVGGGQSVNSWILFMCNDGSAGGKTQYNSSQSGSYSAITTSDVCTFAYDADSGKLWMGKAGTYVGGGDPAAGTSPSYSGVTGPVFPFVNDYSSSCSLNFGQRPFAYTPPTGFLALCQENLPTPATAVLNPREHFDVVTRSGTDATTSITGIQFAPDLVWIKARSTAYSHRLLDRLRGATKELSSDTTGAEATDTGGLTAFNSDGYSLGASGYVNSLGNTFVDWLFKAGGTGVTNTAGSITSTVSANTDLGFSIVTYTGTGANATVGHGLGVAPKMVIVKQRNGSTYDWHVWHSAFTTASNTDYLTLNTTGAKGWNGSLSLWNSTTPSSTVISLGSFAGSNGSTQTYVAYCFTDTDLIKTFSYTGNGSADGPYVHLGGKARWVLVKGSTVATSWVLYDTARNTYNVADLALYPSLSAVEDTAPGDFDIDALGFKVRGGAGTSVNNNAETYIGIAIMDVCGKFALAR
jgi:hypothetical protein